MTPTPAAWHAHAKAALEPAPEPGSLAAEYAAIPQWIRREADRRVAARPVLVERFEPTPNCPGCGARMLWDIAPRTVHGKFDLRDRTIAAEIDASRHEPECAELATPDHERATAIRHGSRR